MLWRQGDVLIETVAEIPAGGDLQHSPVLVYGEATGHSHRIEAPERAEVWEVGGELYLKVTDATRLIHDEHLPIRWSRGCTTSGSSASTRRRPSCASWTDRKGL